MQRGKSAGFGLGAVVLLLIVMPARADAAAGESQGRTLYDQRCGICHAPGGTGTVMLGRRLGAANGVLVDRQDLAAAYLQYVVRNGINGMPAFTRGELTDAELALVSAYLTTPAGRRAGQP